VPEEEMVYPPLDEIHVGLRVPPEALARRGYRLPAEAEWECACRAGTETAYSFGEDETLLSAFAHCRDDSLGTPGRVARFRPNELGFFDMLGNVNEWCHDLAGEYPVFPDGRPTTALLSDAVTEQTRRIVRGGTFDVLQSELRSATRKRAAEEWYSRGLGFRIARTLP
jgi:formylglycine-generating enzyme required for sulfatase activity